MNSYEKQENPIVLDESTDKKEDDVIIIDMEEQAQAEKEGQTRLPTLQNNAS